MSLKSCPADAKGKICRNFRYLPFLCSFAPLEASKKAKRFSSYTRILLPTAENLLPYGIKCTCRACLNPTKSDPIHAAVFNCPCVTAPMQNSDNTRAGSASGRLNRSCGADCCEDRRGRVTRIARVL
ncbi:uncharacterized protein BT62DRAFT_65037 [Guyanagaster necrorhizus]|uniref:Uncharacterized protein n=1 Tax=Guyanagaster necrorhizus TaxID=856835 RepID=A0A9P8AT92_9AGAR|nr:uncharacterized protein BT62DRAFT_65037 [Guyanagaster necrorhizus MCA 3950]KAG7447169.1 hypothetical protein BT62DRAFT_65037 [Guyanagaster necrorhizus MCA 3950]